MTESNEDHPVQTDKVQELEKQLRKIKATVRFLSASIIIITGLYWSSSAINRKQMDRAMELIDNLSQNVDRADSPKKTDEAQE